MENYRNDEIMTEEEIENEAEKNGNEMFKKAVIVGGGVLLARFIWKKAIQPKINAAFENAIYKAVSRLATEQNGSEEKASDDSSESKK